MTFPTITLVEEEIKKASEAYNKFRPRAYEAHMTHKEKLANDIAMDSGRDPAAVYAEIMHADQVKQHFKSIRRKERRGERYGVDRVDIETEDGLHTTVKKEEIETAILAANKEKLLQARDTPLRSEPLRTIIGERMQYEEWEKLLKNEIDLPTDMEEGTRLWFEAIQDFDENPIEINWTTQE